jgi:hypothetical protein
VACIIAEKNIPVISQAPYSPDLAPSDFSLFPTLKMGLKGTSFATMEDIKENATAELRQIQISLEPVLSKEAGSMEQVCVCVCSGNFLTVHRICMTGDFLRLNFYGIMLT